MELVWVCLNLSKQLLAASANRGHGIAQQIASHFVVINFKGAIGQALSPVDWKWVEGDLSKMGDNLVDDPELVKDMELNRSQQPGNPLRLNDFRAMSVIKSGDQIRVTMRGRGFAIDSSGQALSDAALGAQVS